MVTSPTLQEEASQTRSSLLNEKYYEWWKNMMIGRLIGESPDIWNVILNGPTIFMKNGPDGTIQIPKDKKK